MLCSVLRTQFYPFPRKHLVEVLEGYTKLEEISWAQEEPENRGGWSFIESRRGPFTNGQTLKFVGRDASASPATGSYMGHLLELESILSELFP